MERFADGWKMHAAQEKYDKALAEFNAAQAVNETKEDSDPCDILLDRGQLRSARIIGKEHAVKSDSLGTKKNLSKFDLCGCKDGRVVVKYHGCKGPILAPTPYTWK